MLNLKNWLQLENVGSVAIDVIKQQAVERSYFVALFSTNYCGFTNFIGKWPQRRSLFYPLLESALTQNGNFSRVNRLLKQ